MNGISLARKMIFKLKDVHENKIYKKNLNDNPSKKVELKHHLLQLFEDR